MDENFPSSFVICTERNGKNDRTNAREIEIACMRTIEPRGHCVARPSQTDLLFELARLQ